MNQNPLDQRLREVISRRPLTEAEQAELDVWLSAHPEARADWELELALSKTLARDSVVKVSSNFTARIFQEIEREQKSSRQVRTTIWGGWWRALVPRLVVGLVVVVALVAFIHQRNESAFERDIEALASVQTLPSVETLQDFDTIRSLNIVATADEDLLALKDELQTLNP
ncbi:MAG: hypothetical protein HOP33_04050 [Verrucomicrobia bacterium]|nr:hypothetical protein [Verrucomicrobiota bacterium]